MDHEMKAAQLFSDGYNCAQAVAAAFSDVTGLDEKRSARMASSFGGGMGRMREVCGAVSGMLMVLGLLYGYDDPGDNGRKRRSRTGKVDAAAAEKGDDKSRDDGGIQTFFRRYARCDRERDGERKCDDGDDQSRDQIGYELLCGIILHRLKKLWLENCVHDTVLFGFIRLLSV